MIENYFADILQELFVSPVISTFGILKMITGDEDGYIRIKCTLINRDILEFAEYVQLQKGKIHIKTYSFHWQSADGKLKKRWDNVEHHKNVNIFPYHLHLSNKVIGSAPMTLKKVLKDIENEFPLLRED